MAIRNFSTYAFKRFEEVRDQVAFVEVTDDGVEEVLFRDWTRKVQRLALGLLDAGFEPGQRIAIVSSGCRAWFDIAFAAWANGGTVVPLVSGRDRKETLRCLARAGCDWIAADDHRALDTLRGQGDRLPPHLRWVSFEKMRVGTPSANTLQVPDLVDTGRDLMRRGKIDVLAKRTYEVAPDAPAIVLYPLDPGDDPHGAYLGGGKLAVMLEGLGADLQIGEDDRVAPLASLGWFIGGLVGLATLVRGVPLAVATNTRRLEERLSEVNPTVVVCGPAWLEDRAQTWGERLEASQGGSGPKSDSGFGRVLSALGGKAVRKLLSDPIRRELGSSVSRFYLAGGACPDQTAEVLQALELDVLGIWGLPECGISHVERVGATERGSVGRPVQGYVCKIHDARDGERGEVLIRSDLLFDGYWDDEGPRAIVDDYLRTGVQGVVRSGFLFVD